MADIDPVDRAYDEHDAAERESKTLGYFNRCSVCGHIVGVHAGDGTIIGSGVPAEGQAGWVRPHKLRVDPGEGMRAYGTPTWDDYEGLLRRVVALEEVINVNGLTVTIIDGVLQRDED